MCTDLYLKAHASEKKEAASEQMVYVINMDGKPLMPTTRYGHVRRMLNRGRAKVRQLDPFTIQLLYETTDFVQSVDLGIDAGSKTIGVSACTGTEELYAA